MASIVLDGFSRLTSMLSTGLENVRGLPFLATVTRRYLSRRDDIDDGCFVAALLAELPRQGSDVRKAFEHGLNDVVDRVASVNSANFATFCVDTVRMLEPCSNLSVASRILIGDYQTAVVSFPEPRAALWHAISAYNTGSLYAGKPYVDLVVAEAMSAPTVPTISLLTDGVTRMAPLRMTPTNEPVATAPRRVVKRPSVRTRAVATPPANELGGSLTSAGIDRSLKSGLNASL